MAPLTDLTKGFKAILARAGTPDEFENWLKAKKLWHPIDLYLLAIDETRIDEKIIKVCKVTCAMSLSQLWRSQFAKHGCTARTV